MRTNIRRLVTISAIGLLSVAGSLAAQTAWAYFTASVSAEGGFVLQLAPDVDIRETYGSRTKHVVVTNSANSVPVYVRAKAFSSMPLEYSGTGWQASDDGWYYCQDVIDADSETRPLDVKIAFPKERTETVTAVDGKQTTIVTEAPKSGDEHNVEVVYESVPVLYGDNGKPLSASECWAAGEGR